MIVLLTFVRRYQPSAGLGTLIAKIVPFWVAWVLVLSVFYAFDIPMGPGVDVRIAE
jgi:aminobenzoyl-glutamate transport protein